MNRTFYNASGCKDPTAGAAIAEVAREEHETDKRIRKAVHICKEVLELAGFELIGRIQIRDKNTEREYL